MKQFDYNELEELRNRHAPDWSDSAGVLLMLETIIV